MSFSRNSYSSTSTACSQSSCELPSPVMQISSCSISSKESFRLVGDQLLVKLSHVNDALNDFKTEVYDEEGQQECHFVRIVRIGPGIKNKDATVPGVLVVTHKKSGIYLEELSREYREDYYLLYETDIMTYIDL